MKIAETLRRAIAALLFSFLSWPWLQATSWAQSAGECALFVEKSQVCFRKSAAFECVSLNTKINGVIDDYRCLVKDGTDLTKCRKLYIAQNTFVSFSPFTVKYEAASFSTGSSKVLFDESLIVRSCIRHP
jgi:hypothetical protein